MANPSRSIIINNTDSLITYEPANAWTDTPSTDPAFQTGSLGPPFSTSLKTTFQDGNFTFSFNGSSIQVYGSVDIISGTQPTFSCTIDGTVITTGIPKFPQNNWDMCNSGNLEIGQHVLSFNVQSQGSLFFFDYITFLPSADDQLSDGLVRIDPSDLSINYSGNWTTEEMTDSAQLTNGNGSSVTMSFTGQQLTWYGIFSTLFPFASAPAEFSVDGGPSTQFKLGGLINNGPFTAPLANQLLFQTGELSQGPHEVIVTYLGNEEQTDLSLSYVIIRNSSTPADNHSVPTQTMKSITLGAFAPTKISAISTQAVSTNSSSLSNQSISSTSTTSHTFTSTAVITPIKSTPSAITISAPSNNSRFPLIDVSIIVGIILLILIVITLTILFIIKRRNRKRAKSKLAIKQTMSKNRNLTGTLLLPLASSNGDDESTLLCRGRTIRTVTSDSLDGYVTPPPSINSPLSVRTSSFDSTENLFNMPRTRVASHIPTLPTLLDPFVFRVEDSSSTRTSGIFSLVSSTNTPHTRIIRPLSSRMPDGNLNPRVDDATASASEIGGVNNIEPPHITEQHEDSGIRLGKEVALEYEESSSSKGTPPIYTRI